MSFGSRRTAPTTLALSAALVAGCGAEDGASEREVSAVATTTHVADLVRNVGGDRVSVDQFLTPGADPHEYEPRPSDAAAVLDADVVFRSGGDLDSWLDGVTENAGGDAELVTLLDAVEAIEDDAQGQADEAQRHADEAGQEGQAAEDEGYAAADSHWWQDPRHAIAAVEAIAEALAAADPAGAEQYRRNARHYAAELEQLDEEIARCIQSIPADQRELVTTHDAYGPFAERYDIEVIGAIISSRSSQAQPSAGEIDSLVEQIEAHDVSAVFPESSLNPELEEAVAGETGAAVGDALWADSLGPEGSGAETYIAALASDAEAIAEGLTAGAAGCRIEP